MIFFRKMMGIIMVLCSFVVHGEVNQLIKHGGFELNLVQTDGECHLVYSSSSKDGNLALRVVPPCNFHRSPNGEVRFMSTLKGEVMLIESSRPHPNRPKDCDTQIQGVRISHEQIKISSAISKVAMCPPFQWDDVMFLGIFGRD